MENEVINKKSLELRVWWKPQVPMQSFYVSVESIEEGVKMMNVLADYDLFQYNENVKADYSNTGGVEFKEEDGSWSDWFIEDSVLGYFDDAEKYLKTKKEGEEK